MYRLYCEDLKNTDEVPVKQHVYETIFNTEHNIGFKLPSSDTCRICDSAKAHNNTESTDIKLHLEKAEAAYSALKNESKQDGRDALVLCMDLQQALPTPYTVFRLWTYNFCIHRCSDEKCVWSENVASRGADEVASCVLKALDMVKEERHQRLIIYSDSCVGQNKNYIILGLWLYLLDKICFDVVEHKFLLPGHTFDKFQGFLSY